MRWYAKHIMLAANLLTGAAAVAMLAFASHMMSADYGEQGATTVNVMRFVSAATTLLSAVGFVGALREDEQLLRRHFVAQSAALALVLAFTLRTFGGSYELSIGWRSDNIGITKATAEATMDSVRNTALVKAAPAASTPLARRAIV